MQEDKLRSMFDSFDDDKSGMISIAELTKTFACLNINSETWEEMIAEIDNDGNGEVDFEEFKIMMQDLIKN